MLEIRSCSFRDLPPLVLAAFVGACATAAVSSSAGVREPAAAEAGPGTEIDILSDAGVRALHAAPRAVAPSGKAMITHLALGEAAYVGKLEMQAGAAVPEHQDATEEYIHVLEGSGTITIEGVAMPVAAGSTIYMPAGATVSFENGPAPLVGIQVFAGPEPAAKYDAWSAAP